jgi:hypothetical protein
MSQHFLQYEIKGIYYMAKTEIKWLNEPKMARTYKMNETK